jgi:hypothetical protein
LDWIATLTTHTPNKGEQLVRHYGYYSNVSRGKRKNKPEEKTEISEIDTLPLSKELKSAGPTSSKGDKPVQEQEPTPGVGDLSRIQERKSLAEAITYVPIKPYRIVLAWYRGIVVSNHFARAPMRRWFCSTPVHIERHLSHGRSIDSMGVEILVRPNSVAET